MQEFIILYVFSSFVLLLFFLLILGLNIQTKYELYRQVLGCLLLTYMVLGKGIAYLGVAPLYISEVTLALGCATALIVVMSRGRLAIGAVNHLSTLFLLLFMIWSAARTLPYFPIYGFDALRDGVIWEYGLIACCVALLIPPASLEKLIATYGRLLPFILFCMIALQIYIKIFPRTLPFLPGSPVPIFSLKAGDAGVHLAGAAAFLLLRLDRMYGKPYTQWQLWLMWAMWGGTWLLYGSIGRSGMLSALVGIGMTILLRPKLVHWIRPAITISILIVALLLGDLTGISQVNSSARREFSFAQIATNFTSLVGGPSRADQIATLKWRIDWWTTIVGYTFGGEYFWLGKGYGINLSLADEFEAIASPDAPPNRHPHNGTMSVLARSGVPGLALWLIFLGIFGWQLLRVAWRFGPAGETATWLLAYFLASLFNAHSDVYLEGPMGGIWFWAIVGASWVLMSRVSERDSQMLVLPSWMTRGYAWSFGSAGMLLLVGFDASPIASTALQKLADNAMNAAVVSKQPQRLSQAEEYVELAVKYDHRAAGPLAYRLGVSYEDMALSDKAFAYYQQSFTIGNLSDHDWADLLLRMGTHHLKAGESEDAKKYFELALEMDADKFPTDIAAKANFHVGMIVWQKEQDFLLARDYLEKSLRLELDPVTMDRYLSLISTIRDQGDEESLKHGLEMAIFANTLQPDSTWTALLRCTVHLARKEFNEATTWCERSQELAPKNHHAYVWMGLVYAQQKLWEQALVEYEMAATLTTDNSWYLSLAEQARASLAKN